MPRLGNPRRQQAARVRFEALWRAHYSDVLGYALRRVTEESAASDVAAETFTVAWRRFDGAQDPSRAWLLAIARRVLANHLRGERRRDALLARVRLEQPAAGQSGVSEGDELLAAAFNALSAQDREVLSLVTWHELTPAEAAEVLGISSGRFSVRLHRAKARLRRKLDRSGHRIAAANPSPAAGETHQVRLEAK
jgi:RNA polymerase sigma factor (sigma-70 family)